MNESTVTLQGWVGNDVDVRTVGESTCASFRIGCTPRYYRNGGWVDGSTSWFTVNCWRTLGRHVSESVRRGDAVIVQGRVRVDVWERADQSKSVSWIVDALVVGHDLTKGTSTFSKPGRPGSGAVDVTQDEGVREVLHGYQPDGPQLGYDGQPVRERAPGDRPGQPDRVDPAA